MKKILFILSILMLSQVFKSKAQCTFTATVSGYTATFNHLWPLVGIQTLDSVRFFYGDGTTSLLAPVPANSTHTYTSPGTYTVCIIRYVSSLANPGVPIICNDCIQVTITSNNPCLANTNFTSSVSGMTATFTNTTLCGGCPSLFSTWNYGDGSPTSSVFQGSHTYASGGTYMVCLVSTILDSVQNLICTDTFCSTVVIASTSTNCSATANFNSSVSGASVAFSSNGICANCSSTIYSWDYGDGSPNGTTQNPTHTYATSGTYNVCLTVTGITSSGSTCTDTYCDIVTVSATNPNPCVTNANFSQTSTGLTTVFNSSSSTCTSCSSTTYSWNFGDGSPLNSTANPTHTYISAGTYQVCLTITGTTAGGTTCVDSVCIPVTVQQIPTGCTAMAAYTFTNSANNISFTNTSTCTGCSNTTYSWNFGDLTPPNTAMSPSHMYSSNGSYVVCLKITGTATNGSVCGDSICKNVIVTGVGINEIYKNKLDVYPNPTNNSVWVNLPSSLEILNIQIVDLAGRILKETNLQASQGGKIELKINSFNNGLYFIKVNTKNGVYTATVSKQ